MEQDDTKNLLKNQISTHSTQATGYSQEDGQMNTLLQKARMPLTKFATQYLEGVKFLAQIEIPSSLSQTELSNALDDVEADLFNVTKLLVPLDEEAFVELLSKVFLLWPKIIPDNDADNFINLYYEALKEYSLVALEYACTKVITTGDYPTIAVLIKYSNEVDIPKRILKKYLITLHKQVCQQLKE